MKEFGEAKVQFTALDVETDEKYTLSLGKLIENADVASITTIGQSLNTLVNGEILHAKVVESYFVGL